MVPAPKRTAPRSSKTKSTFTAEDYKGQDNKLSPVAGEAAEALKRKFKAYALRGARG